MTEIIWENNPEITEDLVKEHGLSEDEHQLMIKILDREPTLTELGIFSVMWSEHCSYKSSKLHLKTLPTKAPWVIHGPGENAGVIDIGDNQAAIFKMESHNHPSYIEPYQGAATGVGGILRDVFTMGARPIANMNALRFGRPEHHKTRHLLSGVVEGIGGYGNCVGVPTVGGETNFHPSYDGNILVNAMAVGLADQDKIFLSAAAGVGNPVIYVGSKTGRDGIHGATMASAEFTEDSEEKRPTVQVGDPFTEKLLIEACLELMSTDMVVAIQDMGAAGLTSSSVEMASGGGVGFTINLDEVPQREEGMTPYEMMLSESQERMLVVLKPDRVEEAKAIFVKWDLDFAVIGEITDTGNLTLNWQGKTVADIPTQPLADNSPEYDRPWVKTEPAETIDPASVDAPADMGEALLKILGSANMSSRAWIWEQYDHQVMADTIQLPGGDAAVVRVHETQKALAISTDCTPRYVYADPFEGGKQAVAETWRNVTAVGATPMAITDCLNFGNPERPDIMGQFVGAIDGLREACTVLDYPVISGNVSLYNETNGKGIHPTPAIGGVGLLKDLSKMVTIAPKNDGDQIMLVGDSNGHIGCSQYLTIIEGREEGAPPPVDLELEKKNGDFVRSQIQDENVTACHDISDGGLFVALAEMAISSGKGMSVAINNGDIPAHAYGFGEDQARYVLSVPADKADAVKAAAANAGVSIETLGTVGGDALDIQGQMTISVSDMLDVHDAWMPNYMSKEN
ncbi:phosphoribosylformylglycinamidine synthase subunit PurL [Pseudemcibacter aquimaris]|uniref:phosphoribosylformylglycinamidine synthase subunit PurL n=1 Tax=Pseudemcibacter aquimaris TaxID=2857064 RepID=UPI00201389C9|nr:phosphoribosylformylglycinamidine synthase subunit PurL [Pseudemcibacter aquimaris]MCC3859668.1 phosphoribosylformylglycinamidine synthase subunit PurL [Pseudemcibacter aquimaris]WDU60063.1 phosphoribosylformylglycinamidine synthase subunit PurL [Pseudemcibacter aquimaris]